MRRLAWALSLLLLIPSLAQAQPEFRSGSKGSSVAKPVTSTSVDADTNALDVSVKGTTSVSVTNASIAVTGATPAQSGTFFNSSTTGAANTAVVTTVTATVSEKAHLYGVSGYCSSGTASLTVEDGASMIFQTPAGFLTTSLTSFAWPVPLTGTANTALTITLGTCGSGNTGTLTVQADRY